MARRKNSVGIIVNATDALSGQASAALSKVSAVQSTEEDHGAFPVKLLDALLRQNPPREVRAACVLIVITLAIAMIFIYLPTPLRRGSHVPGLITTTLIVSWVVWMLCTRRNWMRWLNIVAANLALAAIVFRIGPRTPIAYPGTYWIQCAINCAIGVLLLMPAANRWYTAKQPPAA